MRMRVWFGVQKQVFRPMMMLKRLNKASHVIVLQLTTQQFHNTSTLGRHGSCGNS